MKNDHRSKFSNLSNWKEKPEKKGNISYTSHHNTNSTFKQALNYFKNSFKNFRDKYIDNFREILMACLPTPLVFLQVLLFHQLVKIYSSFSQHEDKYFRQTNEKR